MDIRVATDDDWPGLWPIIEEVVRAGHTYCWPMDATEDACRSWWMGKPGGTVYVAVDEDGSIAGTAELHPNQPAAGSHVANAGFMVASQASGRGLGRMLGRHVIEEATAQGFTAMQFNAVVATNAHAIRLWQSLGFNILATIPGAFEHPEHGLVGLNLMYRSL
ncbi:GNAT family N-acetyltransferase [Paeniglutamicibacter sp. MACA_103]|uniref:GNAT family N-acetyltransferase n=1 Tax=Paeniglutamicibacter sp. MACA_103 TaxID=3377337 RepID=UPI0038939A7F